MSKKDNSFYEAKVLETLDMLFPMAKKVDFDDGLNTFYIESKSMMTSGSLIICDEHDFSIHVDIPKNYDVPDLSLKGKVIPFKYYNDLFSINPFLFNIEDIKKIIFVFNKKNSVIKFIFKTNLTSDIFLTFGIHKTYISLSGVTVNVPMLEDVYSCYNDLFLSLLIDKKLHQIKMNDVTLSRIYKYLNEEKMSPDKFNNDSLNLIRMIDY